MMKFGVIGAGNIANTFCTAVNEADVDAKLYAIGSRSIEKANQYKETYGFVKAYGSYTELFQDAEIDVIYIATPHGLHYEQMLEILDYKKHILCEKSFTLNHNQAKEIFEKAKKQNVFIMEAVWTRFLPTIKRLQELVKDGLIGDIVKVEADFCFQADKNDENRLFNPSLGGGALLDVGIYPITFANLFMGIPSKMTSKMKKHHTGVDLTEEILFTYPNGEAILNASLAENRPLKGLITGTKGYIDVKNFFYTEQAFIYDQNNNLIKELHFPHEVNGFEYEIKETIDCINQGKLESDVLPHKETLSILKQMDELRASWDFTYPQEKEE
ncbi:MAG: Gfo/Idh/MocA family protein [Candidatus Izemoplasmataceae bacterium]